MTDFSRLDRAQDWLAAVTGSIRRRTASAGQAAWNGGAARRRERERCLGLLVRATNRVDREVGHLVRTGQLPDEGIARARLHVRAVNRDARERASSPLGRASR